MRTLAIIPAWNEAESVAAVVRAAAPWVSEVMVVDDGSVDATAEEARAAGARVLSLPIHLGTGAAVQAGYRYARRQQVGATVSLDADGQHRAEDIERLLAPVMAGERDVVVASRYHESAPPAQEGDYRASLPRRMGIALFRSLLSLTAGQRFTDTTSGSRACGPAAIALFAEEYEHDFHDLESLQRAARAGLRIEEIGVRMLPRQGGETKITGGKALFITFKGLILLLIGTVRPRGKA